MIHKLYVTYSVNCRIRNSIQPFIRHAHLLDYVIVRSNFSLNTPPVGNINHRAGLSTRLIRLMLRDQSSWSFLHGSKCVDQAKFPGIGPQGDPQ